VYDYDRLFRSFDDFFNFQNRKICFKDVDSRVDDILGAMLNIGD
jgi:hypothetical protein